MPVFFFNDTAPTKIYPLSLHDALPISLDDDHLFVSIGDVSGKGLNSSLFMALGKALCKSCALRGERDIGEIVRHDRKSTPLNSSHHITSNAVFSFKKKNSYSPSQTPLN